jgi:hypothetical protein
MNDWLIALRKLKENQPRPIPLLHILTKSETDVTGSKGVTTSTNGIRATSTNGAKVLHRIVRQFAGGGRCYRERAAASHHQCVAVRSGKGAGGDAHSRSGTGTVLDGSK